jgi:diacylglycerol kinase (ATP)
MKAKVILNPYAGRWKAKKRLEEVTAAFNESKIDYDLECTKFPGDGIEKAMKAALGGYHPIISAGGDGSVSEVVNGIMLANEREGISIPPLGIIPLGSANDLVNNLGIPLELDLAVDVILRGETRWMDIGKVNNSRYFDNNSAVGLEPSITLIQQEITHLRGILRYLIATLIGIIRNPQWVMELEWDGGSFEGPVTLVSVGNNPVTGGLFYMTPNANPFDGLFTFVYGYMPTRRQILRLLPRTMKKGKDSYIHHPEIHEVHSTWLRILSENPTPMHADGEIQSKAIKSVFYEIIPGCLPVIL